MTKMREIQAALAMRGYYRGHIDGLYGPQTRAAIEQFQRDNGIDVDGIAGPVTQALLFAPNTAPAAKVDREFLFATAKRPLFGGRYRQAQVDGMNRLIDAFEAQPIQNLNWLAYILATVYHETGPRADKLHFTPRLEKYNGTPEVYFRRYDPGTDVGDRLGNILKGDGLRFRGRGYVQITGRSNYTKAMNELGLAFVTDPDLALVPEHAAVITVRGMAEGWFTGHKLADYFAPGDTPGWIEARRVVNGLDDAALIGDYAIEFRRALRLAFPATGVVQTSAVPRNGAVVLNPVGLGAPVAGFSNTSGPVPAPAPTVVVTAQDLAAARAENAPETLWQQFKRFLVGV